MLLTKMMMLLLLYGHVDATSRTMLIITYILQYRPAILASRVRSLEASYRLHPSDTAATLPAHERTRGMALSSIFMITDAALPSLIAPTVPCRQL